MVKAVVFKVFLFQRHILHRFRIDPETDIWQIPDDPAGTECLHEESGNHQGPQH